MDAVVRERTVDGRRV